MTGNDTLTFIAAAIAAAASLSAVALGIDQLTSGARLRNLEGVLRAARELPDSHAREGVLASVHRSVLAKIIARDAVPLRRFLWPTMLAAVGLAESLRAGLSLGTDSLGAEFWNLLGDSGISAMGVIMWVRLAHERARVADCFQQGVTPIRAYTNILALMEGGFRKEFYLSIVLAIGLSCAGLLAGVLWAARGGAPPPMSLVLGLLIASVALVGAGGVLLTGSVTAQTTAEPRNRDNSLTPAWVHPPDSAAADVGRTR